MTTLERLAAILALVPLDFNIEKDKEGIRLTLYAGGSDSLHIPADATPEQVAELFGRLLHNVAMLRRTS